MDLNNISDPKYTQQVLSNLNKWLSNKQDKDLHSLLPNLCLILFGKSNERGLVHRHAYYMIEFAKPQSPLVSSLLRLQDHSSLLYGMNMDHLPAPTRRILRDMEWDQLPSLYQDKIYTIDAHGHLQPLTRTHHVLDVKPVVKVMFNMFEYYLYSFAYSAIQAGYAKEAHIHSSHHIQDALSSAFRLSNPTAGKVLEEASYFHILGAYLKFFLPSHPPVDDKENYRGKSVLFGSTNLQDSDSIYLLKGLDPIKMISTGEFVLGTFIEVWLCQNDYQFKKLDRELIAFWTYNKPCTETLKSIMCIITHIVSTNPRNTSIEVLIMNQKKDTGIQGAQGAYQVVKSFAYRLARQKLYYFLRLAFENWPRDESLETIVELWITYITPWKAFGESFTVQAWGDYVRDNFLFYTRLLLDFMVAVNKYDVYATVRPTKSYKPNVRPIKFLEMMQMVTDVFFESKLLQHLQVIETALYSLEAYASNVNRIGSITPARSAQRSFSSPSSDKSSYTNCGPLIRSQISFLEKKGEYVPVFILMPDDKIQKEQVFDVVKRLYMNVMEAARRLEAFIHSMTPPPPPSRPSSPSRLVTHQSQQTLSEKIYNFLIAKPDSSGKEIPKFEKSRIIKDIERLKTVGDVVCCIWEIQIEMGDGMGELPMAEEDVFRSPFVEEETQFLSVGPNVFAPHTNLKTRTLTSRGREQIKRGTRKCSNIDIPIIPSQRAKTLIRTFEIKVLVDLTCQVSSWLDSKYGILKTQYPQLPRLDFGWIRLFAAPMNIVLFCITSVFVYTSLVFLNWLVFT